MTSRKKSPGKKPKSAGASTKVSSGSSPQSKAAPAASPTRMGKGGPKSRNKTAVTASGSAPHSRKRTSRKPAAPGKSSVREVSAEAAHPPLLPEHLLRDDPGIEKMFELVMNSPSYKSAADDDPDFLAHPVTRGVRLQLDYLKPEAIMREHRIGGGVVVYGSARTPDPDVAAMRLKTIRALLAKDPGNKARQAEVARAQRVLKNSRYYTMAREFGQIVGREGNRRTGARFTIITGGGPGIMEAANRGAYDVKAPSVGLNISLPHEQYPNPYITPALCFNFHYFAIRKLHFLLRAKALVAFPGGYGTLDELFELLTLVQTRRTRARPIVLVGKKFWDRVFNLETLVEDGMIDPADLDLFRYAESAREAWEAILEWYAQRGQPLVENPGTTRPVSRRSGATGPLLAGG